MKRYRQKQIYVICAMLVVIAGLGIGFAAFSATLNISSSANVTPNSSSFSLGFYPGEVPTLDDGIVTPTTSGGATGNNVTISSASTAVSGLKANFTEPGQTIKYSFYVGNEGEYDAYLRAINFLNVSGQSATKVCTPGTGTTASLVEATCNAISMQVEVNGTTATSTNTSISGNTLSKGTFVPVNITISYDANGARADGPFTIEFGGISLDYSTVDGEKLLSFTINNKTYYFEEGMTWSEWLDSEYNTEGAWYDGGMCFETGSITTAYGGDEDDTILAKEYISNGNCPDLGWLKEY